MAERTMTRDGYDKMVAELEQLKTVTRKEVSEQIKEARSFGDLSENAEYDAAKDRQREVEEKIAELENVVKDYKDGKLEIVDEVEKGVVSIGSKVKILDVEMDEENTYSLVSSAETNGAEDKLSYESPIGAAIRGHKKGDTVTVNTPSGESLEFKILEIL